MPKTIPRPTPSTAPRTAIAIDSSLTMRRSCGRDNPTARKRPISRVRSSTDKASVLTMPSTAMMIANPSKAYTNNNN